MAASRSAAKTAASPERAGITHSRVIDPLNNTWKAQSPDEAYIALLLVDLTNPYGRNQRELNWICRWAQRFAPYCIMQSTWEKDDARAYGLDLSEDHGLRPIALTAAAAVLAMIPLTRSTFFGPMAVAIMGGLIVATLLTLLFVPALYAAWYRVKREPAAG